MHGGFSKDPILLLKVLLEGCYWPRIKGSNGMDKWMHRKQSHCAGSYQRKGTLSESCVSPVSYSTSST